MTDLESIESAIANLSSDIQIRVDVIAYMLRAMLQNDQDGETELAMLLVLEEINDDAENDDVETSNLTETAGSLN